MFKRKRDVELVLEWLYNDFCDRMNNNRLTLYKTINHVYFNFADAEQKLCNIKKQLKD